MSEPIVEKKVRAITAKTWLIVVSMAVPVIIVIIGFAWKANTYEETMTTIIILAFVLGIGLVAAKLSSYSVIDKNLQDIEKLDKAKSDFVAIAAHQLKSPVASLRWRMDDIELSLEDKDWDALTAKIEAVNKAVERLTQLAVELLDVTVIDTGQVLYKPEEFDVGVMISELADDLSPLAKHSNLLIKEAYNKQANLNVRTDKKLIKIVLQNLLSNAIKYSKPHSTIEIKALAQDRNLQINITNVALKPIPGEALDNFFQKFYRADDVREKQIEGSGLGLFIVKSYVEEWGGKIAATSKETGEVCFTFDVPLGSKS